MAEKQAVNQRWPRMLVKRVDAYAAKMAQELGLDISRTDATITLLGRALDGLYPLQPGDVKGVPRVRAGKVER